MGSTQRYCDRSLISRSAALSRATAAFATRQAGLLAVIGFAVCFLSPLLQSGYYSDDTLNSCVRGYLRNRGQSLESYIGDYISYYVSQGRFFPGALALTYTVHAVFGSELPYKCFLLALILSNLIEFYGLLRCWDLNRAAAQLGTLTLVLLLQMRLFADPLLSFAGILQVVAGQLLLSMICWQKYLESRHRSWLAGSLALYASSLVTYEISYFFLPVYAAMAYVASGRWRGAIAAARWHALIVATLALLILGLRCVVSPDNGAYRPNIAPGAVAQTAIRQASAALPLSYALLSEHRHQNLNLRRMLTRFDNAIVALACGLLTFILLRRIATEKLAKDPRPIRKRSLRPLVATGCILWALPGLPIAVSPTYQQIVQIGLGYLPVYVQYIGAALLLISISLALLKHCGTRIWPALVMANTCIALITYDTNRQVVDTFESGPDLSDRRLFEAALDNGLADAVPEGATLLTTKFHAWLADGPPETSGFFATHLRRKVNAVSGQSMPGLRNLDQQLVNIPRPTFAISDQRSVQRCGYVILSSLESTTDIAAEPSLGTRHVRAFVQGNQPLDITPSILLQGCAMDGGPLAKSGEASQPRLANLRLVRSGRLWAIYEGSFPEIIRVATIRRSESDRTDSGSPPLAHCR